MEILVPDIRNGEVRVIAKWESKWFPINIPNPWYHRKFAFYVKRDSKPKPEAEIKCWLIILMYDKRKHNQEHKQYNITHNNWKTVGYLVLHGKINFMFIIKMSRLHPQTLFSLRIMWVVTMLEKHIHFWLTINNNFFINIQNKITYSASK